MLAKLIAIEGPDKSGKATQAFMLSNKLRSLGLKVTQVEAPIKDAITYRIIYSMLYNGWAKKHPNLFQVFQFLNKFIFQATFLLYALFVSDYIIFDRWRLSMIVYGDASSANPKLSRAFYGLLVKPDVTFIMRGRVYSRNTLDDSYEKDKTLQERVKLGYKTWFMHDHNSVVINNDAALDVVHNSIMNVMKDKFLSNKEKNT